MSDEQTKHRWYILSLSMMTFFVIAGLSRMCIPVLFKQISLDLDLSMVAIGTIWGMDPLAGIAVALPSGLLVDRFGIKSTLAVVCVFAGVFGALRGLSVNFGTMAGSMFLFGIMAASVPSIVPKTAAIWFSGRQLGLANAFINITWALGGMVATMFSATVFSVWFGGWRPVLYIMGIPCILLGLLWWLTAREKEVTASATPPQKVPLKKAFSHVARSKPVWLLGIIGACNFAAITGMMGYLPLYLRNIGWTPALADTAMTVTSGVSVLGILPMAILAGRIRSPKAVLMLTTIIMMMTFAFFPFSSHIWVWLLLIINGFLRGSIFTLLTMAVFEMRSIGDRYTGTAIGLMNSLGMLGSFAGPPLGNSLTIFTPGAPFHFWACLPLFALPIFFFVKDR